MVTNLKQNDSFVTENSSINLLKKGHRNSSESEDLDYFAFHVDEIMCQVLIQQRRNLNHHTVFT